MRRALRQDTHVYNLGQDTRYYIGMVPLVKRTLVSIQRNRRGMYLMQGRVGRSPGIRYAAPDNTAATGHD